MEKDKAIVLSVFVIFFTFVFIKIYKDSCERERFKVESVCFIYKTESRRSFRHILGRYFYDGREYETFENINDNPNKYLEKYYKIVLSSKNPNNCEIFYNEEVTDLGKIKKAGF
ncbi:hypothetical protein B0A78_11605 [Flavobacterium columnare NBRC 100251 = ATCC 23463]|uniref:hypothetical protein n=1 Tax=Flavobacterium columnare TaxID=996 RepID=UPI000BE850FF|nr:hypothetical protein [Flavobacterium columnare]MBF6659298.1 hypothetical protein [Flavobacterium columnare]PDS22589.1 hypothetical protein B0A78_11605 [Flavobacterium columnare NBRC 100251 = ATCC 23463]PTD14318.1 hypothetical protein C6N29_07645 [Flavobacterium columnare]GEM59264.1 hypothetical protein FC1_25020 [Flavobacterium columnare NBRC 100251 = ATCC 23463]